ncbi:MAG: PDZ domain-containing protein [Rubrivivax sp.]|nr:PDZ domain-containing protein [Rubrivivax sp.]
MTRDLFPSPVKTLQRALAVAGLILLSACGGGGSGGASGGGGGDPVSCSPDDVKSWLSSYFSTDYFWYALSPRPSPFLANSVSDHFSALLYTGTDSNFPADRWSRFESTESFNRFFGEGRTLGFGVSVAGLEVSRQPARPLYVRSVEPGSAAAAAGLVRGDSLLVVNGRAVSDLIAADDFTAFSATAVGQTLSLEWRTTAGALRSAVLTASIYAITPVPRALTLSTPLGRRVGYVEVRNMVAQTAAPLEAAFSQFRADGVQDIVLDLRYNGGGLVSMGATVASLVGGTRVAGRTYASLLYNDRRATSNQSFLFTNPAPAAAASVPRVFVLMGRRTCSASEQVINGLQGAGIQVIGIGEASCGKPLGFVPVSDACGTTYSVVNFESVNGQRQGRYFTGINASCAVAESWTQPQGSTGDALVSAALSVADGGACPVSADRQQPLSARRAGGLTIEPGERQGMIPR